MGEDLTCSLSFQDGDDCCAQLFRSSRPGPMITDLLELEVIMVKARGSRSVWFSESERTSSSESVSVCCVVVRGGGGARITSETAGPGDALHNDLGLAVLAGIGQFPKENRSMV